MEMDAALWSRLHSGLLEKVLSFVPAPDLCRYRSVCRTWNTLICDPAFVTLHAQNSKRRGASFIAIEMQGIEPLTWCLFDLNARRWYTFRDDNNIVSRRCNVYLGSGVDGGFVPAMDEGRVTAMDEGLVAAMDGGLVCRISKKKSQMLSIFVHDLLGHKVKSLPLTQRHLTSPMLPKAHMVVDSTSHHFTIFLLNRGFDLEYLRTLDSTSEDGLKFKNLDPLMRIYDSAAGKWRSASNPPWIMIREQGHGHFDVVSMVMCQGLLYALMENAGHWILFYYTPTEDAWEWTHFRLSAGDTQKPRLIAIDTRLFVASWKIISKSRGGSRYEYIFEVNEIIIPQMTPRTLFKLPTPDLMELLEVETRKYGFINNEGWCRPWYVGVNVNGVNNTLFMLSWLSGKVKVFDLDTCSWNHGIPKHLLLEHQRFGNGPNRIAKQTNLLLPNSLIYSLI